MSNNNTTSDFSKTNDFNQIGVMTDTDVSGVFPADFTRWTHSDIPHDWTYYAIPIEWDNGHIADISAYLWAKWTANPLDTPYTLITGYVLAVKDGTLRFVNYESGHRHTYAIKPVDYSTGAYYANLKKRADKLTALLHDWNVKGATYSDIYNAYQRFLGSTDSTHQSISRFAKCGKGLVKDIVKGRKESQKNPNNAPTMAYKALATSREYRKTFGPIMG